MVAVLLCQGTEKAKQTGSTSVILCFNLSYGRDSETTRVLRRNECALVSQVLPRASVALLRACNRLYLELLPA